METAPPDVPLSLEVTYDRPDLFVGMSVFDDSNASPVIVGAVRAMAHVVANTYRAKFTGASGRSYVIMKAVYTDDTLETLDDDYAQGSESVVMVTPGGGGGGDGADACKLVGVIENQGAVIGILENTGDLIGIVEC